MAARSNPQQASSTDRLRCPKCRSQLPPGSAVGEVAQCRICAHVFELSDPDAGPDAEPDPPVASAPPSPPPVQDVSAPVPPIPIAHEPVPSPVEPEPAPAQVASEPEPSDREAAALFDPEPPPELPTRSRRRRRRSYLPSPPDGVGAREHPNGLEITMPWFHNQNSAGHIVGILLWIVPLAAMCTGQLTPVFALPFGLFFFWSWLTNAVNRTTVLIGTGGVEITHGPLPNVNGTVKVRAAQLGSMQVEEVRRRVRHGYISTYKLVAVGRPLLKQWNHREKVEYVREAIQAVLDHAR